MNTRNLFLICICGVLLLFGLILVDFLSSTSFLLITIFILQLFLLGLTIRELGVLVYVLWSFPNRISPLVVGLRIGLLILGNLFFSCYTLSFYPGLLGIVIGLILYSVLLLSLAKFVSTYSPDQTLGTNFFISFFNS